MADQTSLWVGTQQRLTSVDAGSAQGLGASQEADINLSMGVAGILQEKGVLVSRIDNTWCGKL